jgi:hypothetical protein
LVLLSLWLFVVLTPQYYWHTTSSIDVTLGKIFLSQ